MKDNKIVVSIVTDSRVHMGCLQSASDLLCDLEISHEVLVMSNYSRERISEYTRVAQLRGLKVIIASGAPAGGLPSLITSGTLLPVLEVAIPATHVGEHPPELNSGKANTGGHVQSAEVTALAHKAARTAAAIVALNDCKISERLRRWQEAHTNGSEERS